MHASLSPAPSARLVLDRRGHPYVSHNNILYRLRFWTEDEWAALPPNGRPVISTFNPKLGSWVGLEPAPYLTN